MKITHDPEIRNSRKVKELKGIYAIGHISTRLHRWMNIDAIMHQFYVAVSFTMQPTLRRLRAKKGICAVFRKLLRRTGTLYVISLVFYGVDKQKTWAHLCDNCHKLLL
jgi:hypothetical protein